MTRKYVSVDIHQHGSIIHLLIHISTHNGGHIGIFS